MSSWGRPGSQGARAAVLYQLLLCPAPEASAAEELDWGLGSTGVQPGPQARWLCGLRRASFNSINLFPGPQMIRLGIT